MKKIKDEIYKSIRYVIPVMCAFLCILILKNFDSVINFFNTNLSTISNLISPLFIGFVIAYILNQPIKSLEAKFRTKRYLSILIVYGALICIIIFSGLFIAPILKSNISDIYASLPKGVEQVQDILNDIYSNIKLDINNPNLKNQINNFVTRVLVPLSTATVSTISNLLINTTGILVNYIVNICLGIVMSVYLLISKEKAIYVINILSKKFLKNNYLKVKEFVSILNDNIGVYLVAKGIDSIVYGITCTIVLHVIGSQYALLLGIIAGITNMIPFFGPIIGTIIAVIVNIFFSFNKAILILVIMIVIQQLESIILEPFFVGKQVGVPPIFTILAVSVASKYTGLLGILLSVPITSVFLVYINRFIEKEANNQPPENEDDDESEDATT